MANNIIEQAKRGLEGFAIGGYHTSCDYSSYREHYYKYFGDPDFETRKYAIAAFTCMLGAWETGALKKCCEINVSWLSLLIFFIQLFLVKYTNRLLQGTLLFCSKNCAFFHERAILWNNILVKGNQLTLC